MLPKNESANAVKVRISFNGNGRGYSIQNLDQGHHVDINTQGRTSGAGGYKVFSVSYRD
jgi:phospholipase C